MTNNSNYRLVDINNPMPTPDIILGFYDETVEVIPVEMMEVSYG